MRKQSLFFACIFLALAGCEKPGDLNNSAFVSEAITPANPSILGVWEHYLMFYSSKLIMKEDGTFQYHNRTCLGKSYTAGTWKNVGDGYLLTSFEQYKDAEPLPTEFASAYEASTEAEVEIDEGPTEDTTEVNNDTISKTKSKFIIKPYEFQSNLVIEKRMDPDTTLIYFERELFILKGDTLVNMRDPSTPSTKYWKTKAEASLETNAH